MAREESTREAYGRTLVELGEANPNIVVLDADLARSTQSQMFGHKFPSRFFDLGLAEQNMIGIAAGLAASGKTVFASTFAVFASARCFDQLRMSIAQPRLNVKIVASHGGITVGEDGFSHHAIEDVGLMCSLPGFTVIVPTDAVEAAQAIRAAAALLGPFYIRLSRPKTPVIHEDGYRFVLGKAVTLRPGRDATIIAIGVMVALALEAAHRLREIEGIDCRVLTMPTVKPLDEEAILQAARETGAIVTAEEHLLQGGLGSRVAQVVSSHQPVPMAFIAIKDVYSRSGKPAQLMERCGLTAEDIMDGVRGVVLRKARQMAFRLGGR
ncbi:MAG TPA: transketolase family protein [Dehalococcoidia bacterium]|nr:transketolase family protein [Dehalococcoidia bacterium]